MQEYSAVVLSFAPVFDEFFVKHYERSINEYMAHLTLLICQKFITSSLFLHTLNLQLRVDSCA
jgi:hypothetical protein